MKILLTLTLILSHSLLSAQDSISVLFIGNSYTYVNDLPIVYSNLSQSLGKITTIDSKTNGGYTFQNHLNDPLTHTKIKSKPWDYVVLQGQSQEPSFPYDQVNQETLPPAVSLADSVYENNFCSQALYFMTWGRENGDPQWDSINTFYKMNERLRNAYLRITDSAQASVAPVGVAWKYVRDNYPSIQLYSGDGSHPSMAGTYLSACTFYAATFRESPVGASYIAGLDPIVASQLQNAAAISVLDSLGVWHIRPDSNITIASFDFEINQGDVNFHNLSWRAQTFEWNFGDGNNSTLQNPSHTYLSNGVFSVELIANSECGSDTTFQDVQIDELGIMENKLGFAVKNLGNNNYNIEFTDSKKPQSFSLFDSNGKQIGASFENLSPTILQIDLSKEKTGIYYLTLNFENHSVNIKVPVLE